MNQYYFNDRAQDKKGIIKAKNKRDFLIKLINVASQYDPKFIDEMFTRLDDAEIEVIELSGVKVYE